MLRALFTQKCRSYSMNKQYNDISDRFAFHRSSISSIRINRTLYELILFNHTFLSLVSKTTKTKERIMGQIITKEQADKLIADGQAEHSGYTYDDDKKWAIITRFDEQRVDHYYVSDEPQPTNPMA